MKYFPFLSLGLLINNLSDSCTDQRNNFIKRGKPEKPIKLFWQVENKQGREILTEQKIPAVAWYSEVHLNIGYLGRISRCCLYCQRETGNQEMQVRKKNCFLVSFECLSEPFK